MTAGREVENYIPYEAIASFFQIEAPSPLGQFQDFVEYLDEIKPGTCEGNRFLRNKVLFAEKICHQITKEAILQTHDLKERVDTACDCIKRWNGMPVDDAFAQQLHSNRG